MDTLDDSENNAKISDSAYSNSCSNSQSRRSHSSKSTHSGSNSSGSSGYGGKPSSDSSNNQPPEKRSKDKDSKKKKQSQVDTLVDESQAEVQANPAEAAPAFETPKEEISDVAQTPSPGHSQNEKGPESMDISTTERSSSKDEVGSCNTPLVNSSANHITNRPAVYSPDGFSCVISMHDGVVMYTTSSLTTTLGFPKDMWIGRSFIDFIHPKDRNTFASQITSGLAVPKIVNGTQEKVQSPGNSVSTMVCRIRRYRGLIAGFGVKERDVTFMPFLLKLTFKNISDEEGKVIYLVIQATPFFSAFKTPNETIAKPVPFVMRHAANGNLEYIDPQSVPYLGFLPQDLVEKDALQLYHPDDLEYLRQVYEIIVKEGGLSRSKTYRMAARNGDYIQLQTEWSSFINPWSRKLEFVIGKHHVIQGPVNPDVFQAPEMDKAAKLSDEVKTKVQNLRDSIIRIMNEVLTKPAEVAKQQMSKRCQDLAAFMESLMEEPPKTEDELRLEMHEPDHSYYERDSVMLGGISPHHEYNDSKSSTETPLSYNQLNYNETLQRYFDSHQPYCYEEYNTVAGENVLDLKEPKATAINCLSPMAQNSGDSGELTSSCESGVAGGGNSPMTQSGDYQALRLTESLLTKHNADMEKELVKMYRETRSSSKGDREKASNESRQKKKEHLARCNASFQPAAVATTTEAQPHGVKRSSKNIDSEAGAHKHHCASPRQTRRRQVNSAAAAVPSSSTITTTVAAAHWPSNPVNNMNTFILGVGIPQQMSLMSPVAAVPGVFPMYYAPATAPNISTNTNLAADTSSTAYQPPTMQCMMYGQAVYGSPFVYSPLTPQVPYQMPQLPQNIQYANSINPLGLTSSNYEEACKPSFSMRAAKSASNWREKKRAEATSSKVGPACVDSSSSANANPESGSHSTNSGNRKSNFSVIRSSTNSFSPKSTEAVADNTVAERKDKGMREEGVDKTDGESSYSSFYSSFFKTESGSAEESSDAKKASKSKNRFWKKNPGEDAMSFRSSMDTATTYYEPHQVKKVARRKMEPPWMEQVCVTSELIYKYQILTKTMDEVLSADKMKMSSFEQPSLVNEQLGQLYLDLQLEGVAARLTLEEGITSSSSSGEETNSVTKDGRRKEYSKLVMIYEEDAPLPPPVPQEPSAKPPATTEI